METKSDVLRSLGYSEELIEALNNPSIQVVIDLANIPGLEIPIATRTIRTDSDFTVRPDAVITTTSASTISIFDIY